MILHRDTLKDEKLELLYDIKNPIVFKEDGLFGYLDYNGEVLIEASFKSAEQFYGNFAAVQKEKDGDEVYEIIDRNGRTIESATLSNRPRYYAEYGIWLIDNKLFDADMKNIFKGDYHVKYIDKGYFIYLDNKNEESGIIDWTGKKIFTWSENYITADISKIDYPNAKYYGAISNFEEREEIVALGNGKSIFKLEDPKLRYLKVEDDNVFRVIDRENNYKTVRWLYIENDDIAFETTDEVYDISIDNYLLDILKIDYGVNYEALNRSERYAYYDVKNKEYLNSSYGKEESTSKNDWMEEVYGYKTYTCSGLYGLMSKDTVLKDCTHTNIKFLNKMKHDYLKQYYDKEYAVIQKDTTVELYDLKNKETIKKYQMASLKENKDSTFLLITNFENDGFTKKSQTVYNLVTDKEVTFSASSQIDIYSNYIVLAEEDDKLTYYNANLEKIY